MASAQDKSVTRPAPYGLAVGIQTFQNSQTNLVYAAADAQAFANTLREGASSIFAKVDIRVLATADETRQESITTALRKLGDSVGRDDAFVFFLASRDAARGQVHY